MPCVLQLYSDMIAELKSSFEDIKKDNVDVKNSVVEIIKNNGEMKA